MTLQFINRRGYPFTGVTFDGRIIFPAKLQMIQLKCRTFGFTKCKHNVLLLYGLHSWDHLTFSPHSGTLLPTQMSYTSPAHAWSQQNVLLIVNHVQCHAEPPPMTKTPYGLLAPHSLCLHFSTSFFLLRNHSSLRWTLSLISLQKGMLSPCLFFSLLSLK